MEKVPIKSIGSSMNNKESWLLSVLVGLIFAGVFCTGVYVMATASLYQPGDTLDPTCAPGDSGCSVAPPMVDGFSGDFAGTGSFSTSGNITVTGSGTVTVASGDVYTSGSFHSRANNTRYYFGSSDQASIYYTGSLQTGGFVIDPGSSSGFNVLTIGDGTKTSYSLNFNASTNHGMITYTGGSTKTFDFGNNAENKILTTGLAIEDEEGTIVYTLPTADGEDGQCLATDGQGPLSWGACAANDTLPSVTGNSGKYLTTNGTTLSWGSVSGYVPYSGASSAVDLGSQNLTTLGNITAGYFYGDGSNITNASDRNLKDNISSLDSSTLSRVMALKPVSFIYKSDRNASVRYGFVAQEVQEIFPTLVSQNPASGDLSLYYTDFSAILAKAIQEVNLKVDALSESGAVGNGEVGGVTASYLDKIKSALASLGIAISDNLVSITNLAVEKFTAETATVKYLQMVSSSGEIYCTWIDGDGNLQKAKGECSASGPSQAIETSSVSSAEQAVQAVQAAQTAAEAAVVASQQVQETAETLSNVTEQAQNLIQNVQDVAGGVVDKIVDEATPKVVEKATKEVIEQTQTQESVSESVEIEANLEQEESNQASLLIQQAAGSLLDGIWDFLRSVFEAPFKGIFAGASKNAQALKSGLPSPEMEMMTAGLLAPLRDLLEK